MGNEAHNPVDYGGPDTLRLRRRRDVLRLIAGMVGLGAIGGAYAYLRREQIGRVAVAAAPKFNPAAQPPARKPQPEPVATVYRRSIVPLLDTFDQRNSAAADRAIVALHDRISMHRVGIAPFAHDIMSWRTRFAVLRRCPGDWWRRLRHRSAGPSQVSRYVNQKFRRHILSEQGLQADVGAVLSGFDQDMRASRNLLYSQLFLPLEQIRTSHPAMAPAMTQFDRHVQERASGMVRSLAPDTMIAGLAAIAGGWVATDVAQTITARIVTRILAQLGTVMAAEGIEAGGATAGGAAAGGGTGSLAGPVGAVIGIGVGLVIGAIVDWRLSHAFEQKVAEKCEEFLERVEERLRDGTAQSPGLNPLLHQAAAITGRVQRNAIWDALKEARA